MIAYEGLLLTKEKKKRLEVLSNKYLFNENNKYKSLRIITFQQQNITNIH